MSASASTASEKSHGFTRSHARQSLLDGLQRTFGQVALDLPLCLLPGLRAHAQHSCIIIREVMIWCQWQSTIIKDEDHSHLTMEGARSLSDG